MWLESARIVRRQNDTFVTTAIITQAAIISVLDKKGTEAFKKLVESLGGDKKKVIEHRGEEGKPFEPPIKSDKVDKRIPSRAKRARQPIPPRPKEELLK